MRADCVDAVQSYISDIESHLKGYAKCLRLAEALTTARPRLGSSDPPKAITNPQSPTNGYTVGDEAERLEAFPAGRAGVQGLKMTTCNGRPYD